MVLSLHNIQKSFPQGKERLEILRQVSLQLDAGEMVALVGPSGSGKTTLLQIAGLLDQPTVGDVHINGQDCNNLSDLRRTAVRRESLGFVYQFHHLLPEFSALENLLLPLMIAGISRKEAEQRALAMLESLGLKERAEHRPAELSGGEQQRVAIGRALIHRPAVLLADEPTGNLDPTTAESVFNLLVQSVKAQGAAALIVTHNYHLAQKMDRMVTLENGVLVKRVQSSEFGVQ